MARKQFALLLSWISLATMISAPAQAQQMDGAKGLYFDQLKKPGAKLNTGLQYWIELVRNGQKIKVNNKMPFKSGDKIRFHVRSNVDGYAYILLRSGSRGEQTILFPDPTRLDDNRVARGTEYAMPADGYLTFDSNPGVEKLTLLLSSAQVDATSYLAKNNDLPLIASAMDGSKDLIPSKILLSYAPPETSFPVAVKTEPVKNNKLPVKGAKKPVAKAGSAKPVVKSNDDALVTVVYKDPKGVLAVDVALEHN